MEQGWWWPTSVSRGVFRDLGSARGAISSRLAHHRHQIQGKICKGTKKGRRHNRAGHAGYWGAAGASGREGWNDVMETNVAGGVCSYIYRADLEKSPQKIPQTAFLREKKFQKEHKLKMQHFARK